MPLYDVSVPLGATTPVYPGDPELEISSWRSLENGDAANVSLLKFGAHTGTHVDAPAHFLQNAATVESLPLEVLIGEAEVIEVSEATLVIDQPIVDHACKSRPSRVLFKTRNSKFWNEKTFRPDYTYLDLSGARSLVAHNIKLVGIDYLSIERFKTDDFVTHRLLLSHGIVILEGLDLSSVPPGRYELLCLPLKLRDGSGDGAPARVVLRTLG